MASAAFLFIAACASALLYGPTDEPWALSAAGDDGRVGVTVTAYRDTLAPGEVAPIRANLRVLVDGPLRFPQGYHQPLAFLYLQTPAGNVFVYPERGISPKTCRALGITDYRRSMLLEKGYGLPVITYDIPMVDPSPEWLDARTLERVRPNLRREGVYEAWVKYTINKIEGVPADAWHGSVETDRIRFTLREIPVAARCAEATAEQIAHLEAYMKYIEDISSGKGVDPIMPEAAEMPQWLSLEKRLQWTLERTENEGFAVHTVALLRKHQAKTENQQYPKWWANVDCLLKRRAHLDRGYGEQPLKILGPYLDEYAPVAACEIERELAGLTHGSSSYEYLNLLLNYVDYKPNNPIRQRLETLARRYAKIPVGAKPRNRNTRSTLEISWSILYALGVFRDGIPFTEAKAVLGEPTGQEDAVVWWNYGTGSRRAEPGVIGNLVVDGQRETIVFTNRDDWEY